MAYLLLDLLTVIHKCNGSGLSFDADKQTIVCETKMKKSIKPLARLGCPTGSRVLILENVPQIVDTSLKVTDGSRFAAESNRFEIMKLPSMTRLARVVLGLSLMVGLLPVAHGAAEDSQILTLENQVWVTLANATRRQPAKVGQVIHLHDKLSTEKNSRAMIRLADRSMFRDRKSVV